MPFANSSSTAGAVREHLDSLFGFVPFELSGKDERALASNKSAWMSGKLLRKRFRRGPLHSDTIADVNTKVRLSLKDDLPLYIIVCFGGYKHFWSDSHPRIDFAELFNLEFMVRYLSPILAAHPPGVILEYESEDLVLPLIDNYPPAALDNYAASFRRLLTEFQDRASLPRNLTIRAMRPQDEEPYKSNGYSERLFQRIDELRHDKEREWEALRPEERSERLHRTPRSIMWKGQQDLTQLGTEERSRYMVRSKILNETYYDADFEFREEYLTGSNHIPVVLTWGLSTENVGHWLTLASTDSSTVDFWIGRGILENHHDRLINRIVSRSQYERLVGEVETVPAITWAGEIPELANLGWIEVASASVVRAAVAQGRAPTRS